MDSKSFVQVITCNICFELFNDIDRCPKILSCGHTFCNACIEKMLVKSSFCPTCNLHILPQCAKLIPVNFTVKGMIAQMECSLRASTALPAKLESKGFCSVHSNFNELRCMSCDTWICGICSSFDHKSCRTLLVKDAFKELKELVSQKVEKEVEIRKSTKSYIAQTLKPLEELRKKIIKEKEKLVEEVNAKDVNLKECEIKIELFHFQNLGNNLRHENLNLLRTAFEKSTDDEDFSKALMKLDEFIVQGKMLETLKVNWSFVPPTIELMRMLCEEQSVYAVENNDGATLYGMVKVVEDKIWISSFVTEKPKGQMFPFKELLCRLCQFSPFPSHSFLKFVSAEKGVDLKIDLVVETDGSSPNAKNFLFLCSGLKGQTYKDRNLEYYEEFFDGRCSRYFRLTRCPPVVKGLKIKTNGLFAALNEKDYTVSFVTFYYGAPDCRSEIGSVVSEPLKFGAFFKWNLQIVDCGLVF